MIKDRFEYNFLIFLVYLGIFGSWIQYSVWDVFTYWDEIYALLFGIVFLHIFRQKKIQTDKENWKILVFLIGYCVCSFVGNLRNNYTTINTVLSDCFVNLKFFMTLYFTKFMFFKRNIMLYKGKVIVTIQNHSYSKMKSG